MRFGITAGMLGLALAIAGCSSSSKSSGSGGSGGTAAGGSSGSGGSAGNAGSGGTSGSGGSAGSGGSSGSGGSGGSATACPAGGTPITTLPACSTAASNSVDVPAGCVPTVDGTLHAEEWSDGTCFNVGSGDMTVVMKYAGDKLYFATSGSPTCGCPMPFMFDPDGNSSADGDEFDVSVFDDPFNTDGDRGDFLLSGGAWSQGTAPSGIVVQCPGNQPDPIRYEWSVPLSALGVSPGSAHTFRFAIVHANANWPAGLSVSNGASIDPSTWGTISSSSNWK